MNVDIRDAEAVRQLRPLEVAAYLRSRGWAQVDKKPSKAAIWTLTSNGNEFEAIVPLDNSLADYALRMSEVLGTLAAAEERSQVQIYSDLMTTFADVIRIRIDAPEYRDGSLPINAHAQVAQKARDLLLAAACSATEHRAVWHTRKPSQAIEQLRKIRIGQSERGSYIVTVISKVSPALHVPANGQLFETEPPFERRVIQTLASSLEHLDAAAASAALTGEFASFEESVSNGVNANLCDAVTGLWGDEDGERSLDFTFSWSPSRPVEKFIPSRVRFSGDRIPLIREAARILRESAPVGDFELQGAVVKLDRLPNQKTGKVTVIGQVEGKSKRVILELGDPSYHLAVQAHEQEKALSCIGELVREGRGYTLQEPRDVTVDEE